MVHISIIIPLYNGIEYLPECIDSVLKQTYTDFEVLVGINGHGADGGEVAAIAKTIAAADPRIKVYVQSPPICSKTASSNDLVEKSAGEWICMLDCDDLWLPTKLEAQIAAKAGPGKNAGVIGTFARYFGHGSGGPTIPAGYVPSLERLFESNPIINSSAMIHRSLCYWRLHTGLEDYDLWLRLGVMGVKFYNVPEYLTMHRIHPASFFNTKGLSPDEMVKQYKELATHPVVSLKP